MFGEEHYSTNAALVYTAAIPASAALPGVIPYMVHALGWMHVLVIAAAFAGAAFVLSWMCPHTKLERK